MKVGAVVICRYNSSRLPGKILKEIGGKPILSHIIARLQKIKNLKVIVGTSLEKTDEPIVDFCKANSIDYFRGSLDNVAQRFLKASRAFNFDYALRVNGDNLFIDISAMKTMIKKAATNKFDFISNVKGRSFPYGMSIEILKVDFYEKMYDKFTEQSQFEHVTISLYIDENQGKYYFHKNKKIKKAKGLKIAIDTKDDFKRAKKIVKDLKHDLTKYDLKEISKLILKHQ